MNKKLLMGLVYIYISIVALSAETITSLGVTFPIMKLLKADTFTAECSNPLHSDWDKDVPKDFFDDYKISGVQGTVKVRHIFDNQFVLGADFDIGQARLKYDGSSNGLAKYTAMNLDLTLGYAAVDAERFTLIFSAIFGLQHAKANLGSGDFDSISHYGYTENATERYTAFEFGGELFMNFRIGDCFGLFASCKLTYDIGNLRDEYPGKGSSGCDPKETFHKTTAFVVKPSVGVSFTF